MPLDLQRTLMVCAGRVSRGVGYGFPFLLRPQAAVLTRIVRVLFSAFSAEEMCVVNFCASF